MAKPTPLRSSSSGPELLKREQKQADGEQPDVDGDLPCVLTCSCVVVSAV